jgi:hypothetical protein
MGPGITAFLNEIVSLNRGERLAGGFDPAAKYSAATRHIGQTTQVDPTVGINYAQAAAAASALSTLTGFNLAAPQQAAAAAPARLPF